MLPQSDDVPPVNQDFVSFGIFPSDNLIKKNSPVLHILSLPRRGIEELVAAFKEENEDPGDQFWFEREILVDITCWGPLLYLLLHANFSFDEAVRVSWLENKT